MNLANPIEAVQFVAAKIKDWANVPKRLETLIMNAGVVQARAREQGNAKAAARAADVIINAGELLTTYTHIADKVDAVRQWLRSVGVLSGYGEGEGTLGFIPVLPVALIAIALAAAAGMYLVYQGLAYNQRLLADVESGLLPPSALPSSGGAGPKGFFDNLGHALGGTTGLMLGLGALALLLSSRKPRPPVERGV